jgi:hypothetical protein
MGHLSNTRQKQCGCINVLRSHSAAASTYYAATRFVKAGINKHSPTTEWLCTFQARTCTQFNFNFKSTTDKQGRSYSVSKVLGGGGCSVDLTPVCASSSRGCIPSNSSPYHTEPTCSCFVCTSRVILSKPQVTTCIRVLKLTVFRPHKRISTFGLILKTVQCFHEGH